MKKRESSEEKFLKIYFFIIKIKNNILEILYLKSIINWKNFFIKIRRDKIETQQRN